MRLWLVPSAVRVNVQMVIRSRGPGISQSSRFQLGNLTDPVFRPRQGNGYSPGIFHEVVLALAEAFSWLEAQGIIVQNPTQTVAWYLVTRRGRELKTRADLEPFARGARSHSICCKSLWPIRFTTYFCAATTTLLYSKHSKKSKSQYGEPRIIL